MSETLQFFMESGHFLLWVVPLWSPWVEEKVVTLAMVVSVKK